MTNGTTETTTLPITIVRPPLMMVHGLASDATTWDAFHYDNGTADVPFKISPLWKLKRAINYNATYGFDVNGLALLSSNSATTRANTMPGIVEDMHTLGYACNRLDYVCHSMGGTIMRTAISLFPSLYALNKNYNKGFINKAITLNTPHNSAPAADFITENTPNLSFTSRLLITSWYSLAANGGLLMGFIKPVTYPSLGPFDWAANNAVVNLQVNSTAGGVNLAQTNVKNHLIASDVDLYSPQVASNLASIDKYIEFMNEFIDAFLDTFQVDPQTEAALQAAQLIGNAARIFTFTEWYSQQKGYPNYLGDGDCVVPIKSQLAGDTTTRATVSRYTSPSVTQLYDYSHIGIHHRTDVGNEVLSLLNSSITGNLFANNIPANNTPNRPFAQNIEKMRMVNDYYDTLKVKIEVPVRGSVQFVDSSLLITYKLKDTVGLVKVQTIFQAQPYTSVSRTPLQSYNVQVSPNFLNKQTIYVIATYRINGNTDRHIDTLSVNVQTTATVQTFSVSPEFAEIQRGQPFNPAYTAVYSTFIASVPYNDPNISVVVDNPSVVAYNTAGHYFIGLDTLSTFAVVGYKNKTDTIYFNITDTTSLTVSTENTAPETINQGLDIKLYPNPTQGQFTLTAENNAILENATVVIYNLLGQVVTKQIVSGRTARLDLTNQPQGMYFVQLYTKNGNEVTKKIQKM